MYDINKILAKIEHADTTYSELLNLHENVVKSTEVSEEDRELINESVVARMRVDFPAQAKKKFGAKDAAAREILQNIYEQLENDFCMSSNTVKAGVKTGGHMISGKLYVNVYISYKNTSKNGVSLSIDQQTADSEFEFFVSKYCTQKDQKFINTKSFEVGELQKASELYREYLSKII